MSSGGAGGGKKPANPKQNVDDKTPATGGTGKKDEVSPEKRDSLKGERYYIKKLFHGTFYLITINLTDVEAY